jgi:hypothetical protein
MRLIHIDKRFSFVGAAFSVAACILLLSPSAYATAEERFSASDDAVKAFTTAAASKDTNALAVIFGPSLRQLVSADPVQASNGLANMSRRVSTRVEPMHESDSKIVLQIGNEAWPFPIPLVKADGQWFFDTAAGREEILNRRIGRNELDTIRVCHAYVPAQREYAGEDHTGTQVLEFAQRLRSAPGQHDGLYWHAEPGEEVSPLGPLVAQAHGEGYQHESKILTEKQSPYHGYYFKILTRQGSLAPGGKYNYIINGHMIAGFALVAWPSEWGNSGMMTFIVNQQDKVYQKNLGPKTDALVRAMTTYDPGPGWKPAEE